MLRPSQQKFTGGGNGKEQSAGQSAGQSAVAAVPSRADESLLPSTSARVKFSNKDDENDENDEDSKDDEDSKNSKLRLSDDERMASKPTEAERSQVKYWTSKIDAGKKRMQKDFDRMRDNQRFAYGLQWPGQSELAYDKYTCNIVGQAIDKAVAALYARDPKVDYHRRERMDFAIWDEKVESLEMCKQQLMTLGPNANPICQAILADYQQGEQWRDTVERIGKIIMIIVQYMMDTAEPNFKLEMKQLVCRVLTNGVGYIRVKYADSFEPSPTHTETQSTVVARMRAIKHILSKYENDKETESSKCFEQIQSLALSIGQSITSGDTQNILEQITFDFPPSESIIVDPACTQPMGFVGARWIAEEYAPLLEWVNEFFQLTDTEREIKAGNLTKLYTNSGEEYKPAATNDDRARDDVTKPHCLLWEVFDLDTKTTFFVVDGCDFYISPPEAVEPETNSFYPVKAITFRNIEITPKAYEGGDCFFFPPSWVDALRSSQLEHNRSRQAWRVYRKANTPKWATGKGWLTENDKDAIEEMDDDTNPIVELEGAPQGADVGKLLAPLGMAPFNPALYDTAPLTQDILQATGTLQENLGPVTSKGTATGQTIAEQSRVSGLSSCVDNIDMLLSMVTRDCGEIILRRFRKETVVRIAGRGAAFCWPDNPQVKEDFINELYLDTVAASSGRPNKALETANFERIAPILINAGANPIGVIEWGQKVMDVDVDISKFFPIIPQPMGGGPVGQVPGQQPGQRPGQQPSQRSNQPSGNSSGNRRPVAKPQQPLQSLPSQNPVPLAAA